MMTVMRGFFRRYRARTNGVTVWRPQVHDALAVILKIAIGIGIGVLVSFLGWLLIARLSSRFWP